MPWQTLDFALEALWFGGFTLAMLAIGVSALWERRPWRDKRTFGERYAEMMDARWREFQARKRGEQARDLAELEAEVQAQGFDIWRPDPRRVREVSEPR